ncbi:MAG TPA: TetR/AcrR family transcriptional regulator [Spirochaetota bacterium]|jgi:AcrR family transcriptional regulator|nr:TetR/AcrR family transcriptional regulator [Spirochaetota bacterium]OQA97575.1 MAG: Fatty acid metabolism regulator protein [Spirochaetes bacterium ADurb.Bin218]HOK03593.1 TetR/AcrR family transcriptional regulator [Spirochaetota bacterium]HOK93869.1 TetR/AcrR family transcriptional regulator [Spirochaetota bacterium]HON15456.1 TetR/AcrR family transcriptional regulator [Spirochaetota bacterium]
MRKKESTEKIFSASLRVFATYGYKKTTVEDIARELNMTKGNLYLYVKDKEDLYRKTVEFALLRWQDYVRGAIEDKADPRDKFLIMCHKAVEYLSIDDDFRSILIHDPEIFPMFTDNDPYEKINNNSVNMIKKILKDGIAKGVFRPVGITAMSKAIFSIYKMFIIRMYIRSEESHVRSMFEQTLDLITNGLFKQ